MAKVTLGYGNLKLCLIVYRWIQSEERNIFMQGFGTV